MGNVEVHDLSPVRDDERKELNLSRKVTYKQYDKHLAGKVHEACLLELPWNIRDSISLYERMNCAFNALTELPNEIPLRLPHLNFIDLSHNQLVTLPESFGLLFHLRTLLLKHNHITHLPESFTHLVKLEKVDLSHNKLKCLPNDFSKMEALSKLNVASNRLKTLPVTLGGAPMLTVLITCDNKLQDPPESVCSQGSDMLIAYLKKSYKLSGLPVEHLPATTLNVFPRVRGNQLETSVPNPHSAQMQYIQSQTHTTNMPNRVKTPLLPPLEATGLEADSLTDRIIGLLYGAAIGDAVGLATCCMSRDECQFHYSSDMIRYSDIVQDGYRVRWKPGDWTSNFDKMVLVLESVLAWAGVVDELEFAKRFYVWANKGFPELGDSEGILFSQTEKQVCCDAEFLRNPHVASRQTLQKHIAACQENGYLASEDERSSVSSDWSSNSSHSNKDHVISELQQGCHARVFGTDNGAVVHAGVLGIPYFHLLGEVEANTVRICKTTHSDVRCISASVVIATIVATMLQGKHDLNCYKSVDDVISRASTEGLKHLSDKDQKEDFLSHCKMTNLTSVNTTEAYNEAYVYKTMATGLVALRSQMSYRSFMMKLTMEAGDSASNGCVAGALLGCKVGYSHLPQEWIQGLRKKQMSWLNKKINLLLDMMGLP